MRPSLREATISKPVPAPPTAITHAAGEATAADAPVLRAAIELAQQIRAMSDEIERGRRIPPRLAAAMKDAGVFGMAMPRVWGGPNWTC
jgi:alkylation response protein AidB-like acyl-CoA dehydrogenase